MTKLFQHPLALAAALVVAAALPALALAAPTLSYGSGTAVTQANSTANFEGNTGLSPVWTEGYLSFTDSTNSSDNGGCGYAAALCGGWFSDAFSGNYFGTTDRAGGYVKVSSGTGRITAIELAVSSGYAAVYGRWQTWLNGVQTGTGQFTIADAYAGGVIGLSDAAGFDELRLFAFNNTTAQAAAATTGFSNPYIDNVSASVLPTPATPALALTALGMAAALRQRRRSL